MLTHPVALGAVTVAVAVSALLGRVAEAVVPVAVAVAVAALVAVAAARVQVAAARATATAEVLATAEVPVMAKAEVANSQNSMPPSQTALETQPRRYGGVLLAVAGALLLLAVGAWQLYFTPPNAAGHQEFFSELIARNQSLTQAEQLATENKYAEALPLYQEALAGTNGEERIQVQFLQARTMVLVGAYPDAVSVLKEIINSENNPRTDYARALAVVEIANIYSRGNVSVNRDIFKDQPFKSLWIEGDVRLTLRHLYELASSIYPTAISQLRIAQWYSQQLPDARQQSAKLSEGEMAVFVDQIRGLVVSADDDIAALKTQETMASDYRMALVERALVLGDLSRSGNTSLGSAEVQFEEAIAASAAGTPGEDGVARYYYALYLARVHGATKKAEVQTVLAPLSEPRYAQAPIIYLLNTAHGSAFYRQFPVQLAKIDPNFKAFLITLGWTEADFSS